MSYSIRITYRGVETDPDRIIAPICRIFKPDNSYVDTQVFTEGGPIPGDDVDAKIKYGKSVYATNVDGWGRADSAEPFISTSIPFPVPLAQFKLAMVGGTDHSVTIETDDYKEAFYYQQIGYALEDQGFEVEVTKN